jgi:hypothetical protein
MGMASSISFSDTHDQLIWSFESKGIYSSKSMYIVINNRGVQPAVCYVETKYSSQCTNLSLVFSQSKIMTRDNLRRKGIPKPLECSLCKEIEAVKHLLFECTISDLLRDGAAEIFDVSIKDFYSLTSNGCAIRDFCCSMW